MGFVGHSRGLHSRLGRLVALCTAFPTFLLANRIIEESQKLYLLLEVVGNSTFRLLTDLIAPRQPGKLMFKKAPTELESHFKPKHERFRFYKRNQQQGGDCVRVRGGTTKTGAEPNLDLKRACELAQGIEAGAAVSLMSETTYGLSSYTGPKLEPYTLKL